MAKRTQHRVRLRRNGPKPTPLRRNDRKIKGLRRKRTHFFLSPTAKGRWHIIFRSRRTKVQAKKGAAQKNGGAASGTLTPAQGSVSGVLAKRCASAPPHAPSITLMHTLPRPNQCVRSNPALLLCTSPHNQDKHTHTVGPRSH